MFYARSMRRRFLTRIGRWTLRVMGPPAGA